MSLGKVAHIDAAGADVLAAAHDRLLGRRGTLILTGVRGSAEAALARFGLAERLFLLPPCAHELRGSVAERVKDLG